MRKSRREINNEILGLAVPSILANLTVPLVGMVDIAVAGHLSTNSAATLIGGITVGSTLFDLLYWNFAFLRAGTGGLTAQAYGRGDRRYCADMLSRSLSLAFHISAALLLIQWVFIQAAFLFIDCTPEVRALAQQYFYIRIWAAPATLGLMALKGWFIGMQDSVSSMATDLVVNGVNIFSSIVLSLGIGNWHGIGYPGVALGTVIAQYSGLVTALGIVLFKYRSTFSGYGWAQVMQAIRSGETRQFMKMNGDLVIRSLCFIVIYIGYTLISARYGDVLLASASIMMKLLMLFSYFTDGFAYAGEAMTGRYMGAGDMDQTRQSIKWAFIWSVSISLASVLVYYLFGVDMIRVLTSDPQVIEVCSQFIVWLVLMPLFGVICFTWDGIYVGATATRLIRNAMIWSVVAFTSVWFLGMPVMKGMGIDTGTNCIHLLMAAYFSHLAARSIYQTIRFGRTGKNVIY
mgnify:CR=1 FL=1